MFNLYLITFCIMNLPNCIMLFHGLLSLLLHFNRLLRIKVPKTLRNSNTGPPTNLFLLVIKGDNESKSGERCLGLKKMHLGFWEVDGGINATGTNDLGGVGGGRSGGGGGSLALSRPLLVFLHLAQSLSNSSKCPER
jgi:hypothetical protein